MKKLLLIAALGIGSLAAVPAKAQVSLSVNIGMQPDWGPRGYDYVDNYYLPDVDCYYNVPTRQYIYLSGGNWVRRSHLPAHYRNYDFHRGRTIVIRERNPWMRHNDYRTRYVTNYRGSGHRVYHSTPRVSYKAPHNRNYNKHRDNYRSNHNDFRGGKNKGRDREYRSQGNYRGGNKHNDRGGRGNSHNFDRRG